MKKNEFNQLNSPKKNLTGFTLIEIMIAVVMFSILISIFTGFFFTAIESQKNSLNSQELISVVSYNLEYMSRSIRMAKKDIDGDCISEKQNYELTRAGNGLKFLNYDNVCQEFFWENEQLYESKNEEAPLALTPAYLEVTNFIIQGQQTWGQEDPLTQSKVFFEFEIKGLKIRTAVSQRNLNQKY